jgi:hypothetical protein
MSPFDELIIEKYSKATENLTDIIKILDTVVKPEVLQKLPENEKSIVLRMVEQLNNQSGESKMLTLMGAFAILKTAGVHNDLIFKMMRGV